MIDRTKAVVIGGALAVCLVAGSPPRIVGDGGEYLAQSMNFALLNGPPLGRRAIATIEPRIHALEPALEPWSIEAATVPSADRRRDFLHFWFYALLATPALWIADAVSAPPTYAFAALNLGCVLAAIWVLFPRLGVAGTALLFASPLVWWIDKPHTEVFTVSLVAIALALMRDRPAWALIAAGAAATQNLPVGVVYSLIALHGLVTRRGAVRRDRAWLAGLVAGGVLACLHPAYTYWRHGTPSLLLAATRAGLPTGAELGALITDPSIGLVGNAPFVLLAIGVSVASLTRRAPAMWRSAEAIVPLIIGAVFLYAAARTTNHHHGATPSLSRYALWLLPLAAPLLAAVRAHSGRATRVALAALAIASATTSVFAFHPAVAQNSREPTWLASLLWTHHPSWNNPLPEVFSEALLHVEGTTAPAATDGCEKVLLATRRADTSAWPIPCYPERVPARCEAPGAICYANRSGDGYTFAKAPGRDDAPAVDAPSAWAAAAEPHVRALYDAYGWWDLSRAPARVTIVREVVAARAVLFGDDQRFIAVVRPRGPGTALRLRPTSAMTGTLIDATTGELVATLTFSGAPGDLWTIEPPSERGLQLLALRAGPHP